MAGGYGIAPFRLFGEELRRASGRGAASSTEGAPPATSRFASASSPWACPSWPPPRTARSGARAGHGAPRGPPRRDDGTRAALRLRARPHAPRGGAAGRRARASGRGEPRSLDGLRHRHLPRLRRLHPGDGRAPAEVPLRLHRGSGVRRGPGGLARRDARSARAAARAEDEAHEPRRRALRPHLEEPAHRRLGHLRLRRRVRGPPRPGRARRPRLEGPLPRAPRRLPHPAHRGDAFGPAERHRPAGRRGAELRARRAAAPRLAAAPPSS